MDYFSLSCKNWCCGGVDAWRVHNLKVGGSRLDGGGTSSDLTVENDVCCEEARVEKRRRNIFGCKLLRRRIDVKREREML